MTALFVFLAGAKLDSLITMSGVHVFAPLFAGNTALMMSVFVGFFCDRLNGRQYVFLVLFVLVCLSFFWFLVGSFSTSLVT